jgi:predicted DNA-binding transcriptional regulator AlpA
MDNPDDNILNKKQAIEFLGLDPKTFDNFQKASEFPSVPRLNKGRYYYDKSVLSKWLENFKWRTLTLSREDYIQCLDFALAMHFRQYVKSDFGTGRQREFGQMITNWVKGQMGEVAVKKFFKQEFNTDIELDFDLRGEIVAQDIVGILEQGKIRQPKIGVGIKSSKAKNTWLILGDNEIIRQERRSEAYIFCRVHIPDDHLLRITKDAITKIVSGQRHYDTYMDKMPDFIEIPAEVAGWCYISDLEKREAKDVPGLEAATGFRHVRQSGLLKKSKEDWQKLINSL